MQFVFQACPCLILLKRKLDFTRLQRHSTIKHVFVCLTLQQRFIYIAHQTCEVWPVCFCKTDKWTVTKTYGENSAGDYKCRSHVLRRPTIAMFLIFLAFVVFISILFPLYALNVFPYIFFVIFSLLSFMTWSP